MCQLPLCHTVMFELSLVSRHVMFSGWMGLLLVAILYNERRRFGDYGIVYSTIGFIPFLISYLRLRRIAMMINLFLFLKVGSKLFFTWLLFKLCYGYHTFMGAKEQPLPVARQEKRSADDDLIKRGHFSS